MNIEELLITLHTSLKGGTTTFIDTTQLINDINVATAAAELSRHEELCDALFLGPGSLLGYVDGCLQPHIITEKRIPAPTLRALFDFIGTFLSSCAGQAFKERHLTCCRRTALGTFHNLSRLRLHQAVQQSCLGLLTTLVEKAPGVGMDPTVMEVVSTADTLLHCLGKGATGVTVRCAALILLGTLCRVYPAEMTAKASSACQCFLDHIDSQSSTKAADMQVVVGTLLGVCSYLDSFGCDGTTTLHKKLYPFLCCALQCVDGGRYDVLKAALAVVKDHSYQLREFFQRDMDAMVSHLVTLCNHQNDKVRKRAIVSLAAFLKQACADLHAQGPARASESFRRLQGHVVQTMENAHNANRYQINIAISSYAFLSKLILLHDGAATHQRTFEYVVMLSERLFSRSLDELEDNIKQIPSLLTSVAAFVLDLPECRPTTTETVMSLLHLACLVYPSSLNFPKMRLLFAPALVKVFYALHWHGALQDVLSDVCEMLLTFTLSSNAMYAGRKISTNADGALFAEYVPLWEQLLKPGVYVAHTWGYPWCPTLALPDDEATLLHSVVVNTFFQTCVSALERFDLGITKDNAHVAEGANNVVHKQQVHYQPLAIGDQTYVRPRNPKDMELFLNFAEFFPKIFERVANEEVVTQWGPVIVRSLIEECRRNSCIGGFYSLLQAVLEGLYKRGRGIDETTSRLIRAFVKETLQRLHDCTHQLLQAALSFVLSLPERTLPIPDLVAPWRMALDVGRTDFSLARLAMTSLESYMAHSLEELRPHLPDIFDLITSFLVAAYKALEEADDGSSTDVSEKRMAMVRSDKGQRSNVATKAYIERDFSTAKRAAPLPPSAHRELEDLQFRVIRFIGQMGYEHAATLKSQEQACLPVNMRWSPNARIKIKVTLKDTATEVSLDALLPRVVDLAVRSSERHSRVAAAELLHALTLWMVGTGSAAPIRQDVDPALAAEDPSAAAVATPFYEIYNHVFPALVQLSVSQDSVLQQLFRPLLFQLIRWFTQTTSVEYKETMSLLEALIGGLTSSTDCAMRDTCAEGIQHFLQWCVKHGRARLHNISSLIRRLYALSQHASVWYRLGSVLAFNKFHRDFREIDELVGDHAMEMVVNGLMSLLLSDPSDATSEATTESVEAQWIEFLTHMERIVVYKASLLLPRRPRKGQHECLEDLVHFLFEQCGVTHVTTRRMAMRLFTTFCTCLPQFNNDGGPMRWLVAHRSGQGAEFYRAVYEGITLQQPQLALKRRMSLAKYLEWCAELETSLDCYVWMLQNNFIVAHTAFGRRQEAVEASAAKKRKTGVASAHGVQPVAPTTPLGAKLLHHLYVFIVHWTSGENMPGRLAESQGHWLSARQDADDELALNTEELSRVSAARLAFLEALCQFLRIMCTRFPSSLTSDFDTDAQVAISSDGAQGTHPVLHKALFVLLRNVLAQPERLGLAVEETKAQDAIDGCASSMLSSLSGSLSTPSMTREHTQCCEVLRTHFHSREGDLTNTDTCASMLVASPVRFLSHVRSVHALLSCGMLEHVVRWNRTEGLGDAIFGSVMKMPPATLFHPRARAAIVAIWNMCVAAGVSPKLLLSILTDETSVCLSDVYATMSDLSTRTDSDVGTARRQRVSTAPRGRVVHDAFHRLVASRVLHAPADYIPLFSTVGHKHGYLVDSLKKALDLARSRRGADPTAVDGIVDLLMSNLGPIASSHPMRCMSLMSDMVRASRDVVRDHAAINSFLDFLLVQMKCIAAENILSASRSQIQIITTGLEIVAHVHDDRHLAVVKTIIHGGFPLHPNELSGTRRDTYMDVCNALLTSLARADNVAYLRSMWLLFRCATHPLSSEMLSSLRSFFDNLNDISKLECAAEGLAVAMDESHYPIDVRVACLRRITLSCVASMTRGVLSEFYCACVGELVSVVSRMEFTTEEDVVSRTGAFQLMEALYTFCDIDVVRVDVTRAFVGSNTLTGKELTERIIKAGVAARQLVPKAGICADLIRKFYQAAYNCLSVVIQRTQRLEKFFHQFLFREKVGDIWENIVDMRQVPEFAVETSFTTTRSGQHSLIQRDEGAERPKTIQDSQTGRASQRLKYLSSQYLVDSTLRAPVVMEEDSSQPNTRTHRQSTSTLLPDVESITQHKQSLLTALQAEAHAPSQVSATESMEPDAPVPGGDETLELDDINSHPCMPALLRSVDILSSSIACDTSAGMPQWMKDLHSKITNPVTHTNVRLFIAKLVLNRPTLFEPYAASWYTPLARLAVCEDINKIRSGLNYVVRDICFVLLSWESFTPSSVDAQAAAEELVAFAMRNCSYTSRFVLRSNLDLVKNMVERWGTSVVINKGDILGWLCYPSSEPGYKLARGCGLQLVAILVANDLPPYDAKRDHRVIPEIEFYRRLCANLTVSAREVNEACSEVVGLAIKLLDGDSPRPRAESTILRDVFLTHLNEMFDRKEYERLLYCLNKATLHMPSVADPFVPHRLLTMWTSLHGIQKTTALELMRRRAGQTSAELYSALHPYVADVFEHSDEAGKAAMIDTLRKLVPSLLPPDVHHLITVILNKVMTSYLPRASLDTRIAMYTMLIHTYDCIHTSSTKMPEELVEAVSLHISSGLLDDSTYIRDMVLKFWDSDTRLPGETYGRLEAIFRTLNVSQLGDAWLQFSSILMLFLAHRAPEFAHKDAFFAQPLANCAFREVNIDSAREMSLMPQTPMFATNAHTPVGSLTVPLVSLRVSRQQEDGANGASPSVPAGHVLATQQRTLAFTPTQQQTSFSAYEPQLSLDATITQSTLMFNPTKGGFGTNMLTDAKDPSCGVRRRFNKVEDKYTTKMHLTHATRQQREKEALTYQEKLRRSNKVSIYRTYRDGEVPDVQISCQSIVVPLQALCLHDVEIARVTFTSLFSVLYELLLSNKAVGTTAAQTGLLSSPTHFPISTEEASRVLTTITGRVHDALRDGSMHSHLTLFLHEAILAMPRDALRAFDIAAIYESSLLSQQHATACLLVEAMIESKLGPDNDAARLGQWCTVADLFRGMHDMDGVRSVVARKLFPSNAIVANAMESLVGGRPDKARRLLTSVLTELHENPNYATVEGERVSELLRKTRHEVSVTLLRWKDIQAETDALFSDPERLDAMWSPERVDLLNQFLLSKMHNVTSYPELRTLLSFIMENDAGRRDVLLRYHCNELSLLALHAENVEEARQFAKSGLKSFLYTWSSVPATGGCRPKVVLMRNLQSLCSISDALELVSVSRGAMVRGPGTRTRALVDRWLSLTPEHDDEQEIALPHLLHTQTTLINCVSKATTRETVHSRDQMVYDLTLKTAEATCQHPSAAFVTQRLLDRCLELQRDLKGPDAFHYTLWSLIVKNTMQRTVMSEKNMSGLVKIFDGLYAHVRALVDKHKLHTMPQTSVSSRRLIAELCTDIVKSSLSREYAQDTPQETLSSVQRKYAAEALSEFSNVAALGDTSCRLQLAQLCDTLISHPQFRGIPSSAPLPVLVVQCIVDAMEGGSVEARVQFPRVLAMLQQYPMETADVMQRLGQSINTNNVLPWIAQCLSLLMTPAGHALAPLLRRLAAHHPQVFLHHWCTTHDDTTPAVPDGAPESVRKLCIELSAFAKSAEHLDKLRTFVVALERMHHPELRFRAYWEDMRHHVRQYQEKGSHGDAAMAQTLWERAAADCLDPTAAGIGEYNRKFAQHYGEQLRKELTVDGRTLRCDMEAFRRTARMVDDMKRGMTKGSTRVQSFSEWLARFAQVAEEAGYVEVPVQPSHYLTTTPPAMPHRIVRVSPNMQVMTSVQRPKKLTFIGSDERSYSYLVKGGDDLRLDQRVQQMMAVVNVVLRHEPTEQRTKLRVYSVVPMSPRVGLIEWCDNTIPLKAMIEAEMKPDWQRGILTHPVVEKYTEFIQHIEPNNEKLNLLHRYLLSFKRHANVQGSHAKRVQGWLDMVPKHYLKNSLASWGAGPASYYLLRKNFISSYGAVCACGYVLGIGDRHLENFLVDQKSGEVIAIDFGHAFGSATTQLSVPELVPFRMTQQIVNVMGPHGTDMVHPALVGAMHGMRRHRDVLVGVLGVFLTEPLTAWQRESKKLSSGGAAGSQTEGGGDAISHQNQDIVAARRLDVVRRKLNGAHPSTLTIEEVRQNPHVERVRVTEAVAMAVQGDETHVRRGKPDVCESVSQQVDFLLEQACDLNLLGRTWVGWAPFF